MGIVSKIGSILVTWRDKGCRGGPLDDVSIIPYMQRVGGIVFAQSAEREGVGSFQDFVPTIHMVDICRIRIIDAFECRSIISLWFLCRIFTGGNWDKLEKGSHRYQWTGTEKQWQSQTFGQPVKKSHQWEQIDRIKPNGQDHTPPADFTNRRVDRSVEKEQWHKKTYRPQQ